MFWGFDELRQEQGIIKRQSAAYWAAAKEAAWYTMLQPFPHPNILKMYRMWMGQFHHRKYHYIAMEACHTTLWKYLGVVTPHKRVEFRCRLLPYELVLDTVKAVGHLHSLGVVHGEVSLSNMLLRAAGEVKLADFGATTAHTF